MQQDVRKPQLSPAPGVVTGAVADWIEVHGGGRSTSLGSPDHVSYSTAIRAPIPARARRITALEVSASAYERDDHEWGGHQCYLCLSLWFRGPGHSEDELVHRGPSFGMGLITEEYFDLPLISFALDDHSELAQAFAVAVDSKASGSVDDESRFSVHLESVVPHSYKYVWVSEASALKVAVAADRTADDDSAAREQALLKATSAVELTLLSRVDAFVSDCGPLKQEKQRTAEAAAEVARRAVGLLERLLANEAAEGLVFGGSSMWLNKAKAWLAVLEKEEKEEAPTKQTSGSGGGSGEGGGDTTTASDDDAAYKRAEAVGDALGLPAILSGISTRCRGRMQARVDQILLHKEGKHEEADECGARAHGFKDLASQTKFRMLTSQAQECRLSQQRLSRSRHGAESNAKEEVVERHQDRKHRIVGWDKDFSWRAEEQTTTLPPASRPF